MISRQFYPLSQGCKDVLGIRYFGNNIQYHQFYKKFLNQYIGTFPISICQLLPKSSSTTASFSSSIRRKKRKGKYFRALQKESQQNKIFFQSLGCPRNWVDSEVMLGSVIHAGYEPTQELTEADILVINTCGFLQTARDESKQEIEHLLSSKKSNSQLIVTGCMVNLHKDEILQSYPEIDHVLGSASMDKIVNVIQSPKSSSSLIINQEDSINQKFRKNTNISPQSFLENGDVRMIATPKHYAYLKVAEGCRKRCSFCIIPKIKGPLQSKPESQIISEFKSLLAYGTKEIIFIAQDLGDYGKDKKNLYPVGTGLSTMLRNLLETLPSNDNEPQFWLRLMYLYPDEITEDLIQLMEEDERICRYLDMPIQHINNYILKRMKRKTSGDDIKQTIQQLRHRLPDIHIRTSLMVGFPGETEEHFNELLDFVKEFKLDNVGTFMYSNEEMALSSRLNDHISEEVKEERYAQLMEAQYQVMMENNMHRVQTNQIFDVVIEQQKDENTFIGRYFGQAPDIDSHIVVRKPQKNILFPILLGERYKVQITDFDEYDLIGNFVTEDVS